VSQFRVDSEVGKLRKVLVHRPDLSLRRLTPTNREELLFDDVLWVRKARGEHDKFTRHLEKRGVEVFYLDDLLTDVLKISEARVFVIDKTVTRLTVGASLVRDFRAYLLEMDARRLATMLIGGLGRQEIDDSLLKKHSLTLVTMDHADFVLPPLPNSIFTRDSSSWIFNGVTLNPMFYEARQLEVVHAAAIYNWHPMFADADFEFWYRIRMSRDGSSRKTGAARRSKAATSCRSATARCLSASASAPPRRWWNDWRSRCSGTTPPIV